jgi:phosphate-selective porin OprO and OprP
MRATQFIVTMLTVGAIMFTHSPTQAADEYDQFVSGISLADSLEDVQKELEAQSEELGDLNSAIKKKVDPGTSKTSMKVSGRIHADYWGFPNHDAVIEGFEGGNPQDRIGFRRMRIGVSGKLPGNMTYKLEMEFAGGNMSEFRNATLGWEDLPFFQRVRIGNQKRPYSLDQNNSSRYNVFLERPFISEAFNQNARRFGIQSNSVSDDLRWNWRYGVFNTELIQNDGQHINDHVQLEFAGRLANTFWYDEASDGRAYGHWALSGTTANVDGGSNETRFRTRAEARHANRWLNTGTITDADKYEMLGAEGVINLGALQMVTEYQGLWMHRDVNDTVFYHGGYVYLSYFLTGEHMPWDRKSGNLGRIKPHEEFFLVRTCDDCVERGLGAWQLAIRWSYADFSEVVGVPTAVGTAGVEGDAVTLGLNWYWTEQARVQFNWSHGTIKDAGGAAGDYDSVGARFSVDF